MIVKHMHISTILVVAAVSALALIAAACSSTDAAEPIDYFTERMPPCQASPEVQTDPCARRSVRKLESEFAHASSAPLNAEVLALETNVTPYYYSPDTAVVHGSHVVLRGTVLPDTTRCGSYITIFHAWTYQNGEKAYDSGLDVNCFVDVDVRDYIFGKGPSRVTIIAHREMTYGSIDSILRLRDDYDPTRIRTDVLENVKNKTVAQFEGGEWVFFLSNALNEFVEAWGVYSYWDVQRDESGQVVVVSRHKSRLEGSIQGHTRRESLLDRCCAEESPRGRGGEAASFASADRVPSRRLRGQDRRDREVPQRRRRKECGRPSLHDRHRRTQLPLPNPAERLRQPNRYARATPPDPRQRGALPNRDTHLRFGIDAEIDADGYRDSYPHFDGYTYADCHSYTYGDPDGHTNHYPRSYGYSHAYLDGNLNIHTDADCHPYTCGDPDGYTDSYSN